MRAVRRPSSWSEGRRCTRSRCELARATTGLSATRASSSTRSTRLRSGDLRFASTPPRATAIRRHATAPASGTRPTTSAGARCEPSGSRDCGSTSSHGARTGRASSGSRRRNRRRARSLRLLSRPGWLAASELRIGLGCMRLSTDEDRDEERAFQTIAAAADAGITVFDTAHSYGLGEGERGHNEMLLARALRLAGTEKTARIVTKGGMARTGGGWIPDGRAKAIRSDCEASAAALDGLAIDLYLIHAPDPRTPWRTSARAMERLVDEGLVRRVGVANVNRAQLDEALEHAPIAAVQVAVNPFDDRAIRGGVVERCEERGIAVIAHSPLGGPRRAGRLARHEALAEVATARGATPSEVALAWLLGLSPVVVAIPGARRRETARSAAGAASVHLDVGEL